LLDEENDLLNELVSATPTTLAGCAAALKYLESYAPRYGERTMFGNFLTEGSDDWLTRIANVIQNSGK